MRTVQTPESRVFVVENHDQAYYVWRDQGVARRVLVHIDAHPDMNWVRDGAPVTIADFICPALTNELVREIVWVVPDPTWESAKGRWVVLRYLKRILSKYPESAPAIAGKDQISARIMGRPLRVCPLRLLPEWREPVLLDIDVDFLLIPILSGTGDIHSPLPWCWPEDVVSRLCERGLRSDLITIAYSVEGGYTPLQWKYLGDELALRLGQPGNHDAASAGMALMRAQQPLASEAMPPWRSNSIAEPLKQAPTRRHLVSTWLASTPKQAAWRKAETGTSAHWRWTAPTVHHTGRPVSSTSGTAFSSGSARTPPHSGAGACQPVCPSRSGRTGRQGEALARSGRLAQEVHCHQGRPGRRAQAVGLCLGRAGTP